MKRRLRRLPASALVHAIRGTPDEDAWMGVAFLRWVVAQGQHGEHPRQGTVEEELNAQ